MKKSILLLMLIALMAIPQTLTAATNPSALSPPDDRTAEHLSEGFEGTFPPSGWSIMTAGLEWWWQQCPWSAYEGSFCAYQHYGVQGIYDEWLVTPALDTTGVTNFQLEFYETGFNWTYSSQPGQHEILVSTTVPDNPDAFTSILTMTPDTYTAPWLDSNGDSWGTVELDLSAYAGQPTVYVALRYLGQSADNWFVDNFRLFTLPDHDVMAANVIPDGEFLIAGSTIVPQVAVQNGGMNTETFDVQLTIDHDGTGCYSETVAVTDLARGEVRTADFPSFTAEAGHYELTGTSMLAGDQNPMNDVAAAASKCYSDQRTPLGMLVTNWGCGYCPVANQALDEYMATQGDDVALIRVHGWWPSGDDPMYVANTEQCDYLIENTPTGADYAPHLWLDNYVDAGFEGEEFETFFEDQKLVGTPLTMGIEYDAGTSEATVTIHVFDPMPLGDFALCVVVTEDNVDAMGPTGERYHNQVFRWLYPDTTGTLIDTSIGTNTYVVPLSLGPGWIFSNLRATAWVQDADPAGMIMNSCTTRLESIALDTVGATYTCTPQSGTLPFSTSMSVTLTNLHTDRRKIAGRIGVALANGTTYSTWRAGFTNINSGESYVDSWEQNIPALGSLVGNNVFLLTAEDVTPAPYNQPPHPPAGDTATASCTVTGVAP